MKYINFINVNVNEIHLKLYSHIVVHKFSHQSKFIIYQIFTQVMKLLLPTKVFGGKYSLIMTSYLQNIHPNIILTDSPAFDSLDITLSVLDFYSQVL